MNDSQRRLINNLKINANKSIKAIVDTPTNDEDKCFLVIAGYQPSLVNEYVWVLRA